MKRGTTRVPKRTFNPPRIGDPGRQPPKNPPRRQSIPPDLDLDSLTTSELFTLALQLGIPAKELCAVQRCSDALAHVLVDDRKIKKHLQYGHTLLWCEQCYHWVATEKLGNFQAITEGRN